MPSRPGLRPTSDRVRETLFNWLGQRLDGLACLDLFAGSGALGFEAASRGAAHVVMVENDKAAFSSLKQFRDLVGSTPVELVFADAYDYLSGIPGRFDVVFLDPPFRQNAAPALLERLPERLKAGARVYLEAASPIEPKAPWQGLRAGRAGQVSYQLLQWRGDDQGGLPGDI